MKQFNLAEERSYPQKIYASQLLTVEDPHQLQKRILEELLSALKIPIQPAAMKWLKYHEVRRILKFLPGALQNLKNTGAIPFCEQIQRLLNGAK